MADNEKVKLYGSSIYYEFPYNVPQQEAYSAIVKKMQELGILKVEKEKGLMGTRYLWAIKAVKWDG